MEVINQITLHKSFQKKKKKKIEKYRITYSGAFEIEGNWKYLILINTGIFLFPEDSTQYIAKSHSQAKELLSSVKINNIAWKRT